MLAKSLELTETGNGMGHEEWARLSYKETPWQAMDEKMQ